MKACARHLIRDGRHNAAERVVGAGAQIDVEVVQVAHDVLVQAERGHHPVIAAAEILATADHDLAELVEIQGLERFRQRRRVG